MKSPGRWAYQCFALLHHASIPLISFSYLYRTPLAAMTNLSEVVEIPEEVKISEEVKIPDSYVQVKRVGEPVIENK